MAEKLNAGDTVIATKTIRREDGRCHLLEGRCATVVSAHDGEECQIVAIRLDNGDQMISIIVQDGIPLIKL